jgi:hypothetical protein
MPGPVSTYITSSAVRVPLSVSRNVTTDRSRSAKTLVGTSQINSLASSGFTDQHASPSEPQWKASSLPAVSKQQRRQPTSTTSRQAIATDRRPVTSRSSAQAPHNGSRAFRECINKSAYHLQPSINCGYKPHRSTDSKFTVEGYFKQHNYPQ